MHVYKGGNVMDSESRELWETKFKRRHEKPLQPRRKVFSRDEVYRGRKSRDSSKEQRKRFRKQKSIFSF